jgi:hypothetical protein
VAEAFHTPYTDYDVLAKRDSPSWDDFTRAVVDRRLSDVPLRRFFTEQQWDTLEAISARLLPQPDRTRAPVPITPFIDDRLARARGDGYRYEDLPEIRTAWRLGLAAIEDEALRRERCDFRTLGSGAQDRLLRAVQAGDVISALWRGLAPSRFFTQLLLKWVVATYYAHPAAWSEVGFGGPASPRGYVRRELGTRDRWEAEESWNPAAGEDDDAAV